MSKEALKQQITSDIVFNSQEIEALIEFVVLNNLNETNFWESVKDIIAHKEVHVCWEKDYSDGDKYFVGAFFFAEEASRKYPPAIKYPADSVYNEPCIVSEINKKEMFKNRQWENLIGRALYKIVKKEIM